MFGAGGGVDTAVRELQEEVDDLTKALEQAKEHEQMALDRQRRELTGTAEEKMAAREARLREQRVEEWNCRALRRMRHLKVVRGWERWREEVKQSRRVARLLRAGVEKLPRPPQYRCFQKWYKDWHRTEAERVRTQQQEMLLLETREEHQARMAALRDELSGKSEEQLKLERAQARHERVQSWTRRFMRGLHNKELRRGYVTWADGWREARRLERVLKVALARLGRPRVIATFNGWRRDWEATELAAMAATLGGVDGAATTNTWRSGRARAREAQDEEERSARAQLKAHAEAREAAQEEVERLREALEEVEERLAQAQEHEQMALDRQRWELVSSAEEQATARAAREKEERVEQMYLRASRRLAKHAYARGWSTWHGHWAEEGRIRRLLRHGAARLMLPRITCCLAAGRKTAVPPSPRAAPRLPPRTVGRLRPPRRPWPNTGPCSLCSP